MENNTINNPTRYALITGATSGIGYELAKLFAMGNYGLVLVARNLENLKVTSGELAAFTANPIYVFDVDLFEDGAAEDIYNRCKESCLLIEVLVNNAGQGEWGKFTTTELQREIDIIHLNVIATMTLTKLFLQDMVARDSGKILQLASSVSKVPSPYLAVYAATKAFVLSLTEALINEVEDTNVTITALQPGPTDTDFFHKAKAETSVIYREASFYSPEEVARAGYEGLMEGEATVVPGLMNKTQGYLNLLLPDSAVADSMEKQLKPSTKEKGKVASKHQPSVRERKAINAMNGSVHGDY